jgi:hypothetical protein
MSGQGLQLSQPHLLNKSRRTNSGYPASNLASGIQHSATVSAIVPIYRASTVKTYLAEYITTGCSLASKAREHHEKSQAWWLDWHNSKIGTGEAQWGLTWQNLHFTVHCPFSSTKNPNAGLAQALANCGQTGLTKRI